MEYIKNLFKDSNDVIIEDPFGKEWGIWDNEDKYMVYYFKSNELRPHRYFGGPWAHDTNRYKFTLMGIHNTLNRLNLK